jgi:hypothetical protein
MALYACFGAISFHACVRLPLCKLQVWGHGYANLAWWNSWGIKEIFISTIDFMVIYLCGRVHHFKSHDYLIWCHMDASVSTIDFMVIYLYGRVHHFKSQYYLIWCHMDASVGYGILRLFEAVMSHQLAHMRVLCLVSTSRSDLFLFPCGLMPFLGH